MLSCNHPFLVRSDPIQILSPEEIRYRVCSLSRAMIGIHDERNDFDDE